VCGAGGPDPKGGQYSWPDINRCLTSELSNAGGWSGERWTQDADKGHGTWNKDDGSGKGYAGGVDEDGKPHHHDPFSPHHH
jgi:hypothetical protein